MDERRTLELYREWLPFNFSGGGEVTGPAVRVGHGMRESDFQALEPIQDAWRVGPGGRSGSWLATGLHAGSTDLGRPPV